MGYYLNPGNSSFRETIRSRIYVDKTNLIAWINHDRSEGAGRIYRFHGKGSKGTV